MIGEASKTSPMSGFGVVQSRVLCLQAINGAVEACCLRPDFRYNIASDMSLEGGGIIGSGIREQAVVDKRGDFWSMHFCQQLPICW